jgi:hypothetical protein
VRLDSSGPPPGEVARGLEWPARRDRDDARPGAAAPPLPGEQTEGQPSLTDWED